MLSKPTWLLGKTAFWFGGGEAAELAAAIVTGEARRTDVRSIGRSGYSERTSGK